MNTTHGARPNGPSRTPRPSSDSVKITFLDGDAVRRRVEQAVLEMAGRRPEIERVVLFGSLARGDAVPGSDADLLVILASADRPFIDRIPLYIPEGCPVSVDVFPYTREEHDRMLVSGHGLLRRALADGVTIFDRGAI